MDKDKPNHKSIVVIETWVMRWDDESSAGEVIYETRVTVDATSESVEPVASTDENSTPTTEPTSSEAAQKNNFDLCGDSLYNIPPGQ